MSSADVHNPYSWLAVGFAVGGGVGAAVGHIALGVGVGLALGAVGAVLSRRERGDSPGDR
jgi:hypothetical protein